MNTESPKLGQSQEQPKKEFEINYDPFDPEAELKNLRHGDKETRDKKLKKYKEELIKQKEGISEIQIDLEKQIRKNPELIPEELMKTVFAKAPQYRLSENQLNLFKETLNKYTEKHQAIRRARKEYPDDKELFKACFGKYPEGKIKIIETPIMLFFRCYNLKDYAWIRGEKFLDPENKQDLTEEEIKSTNKSAGICIYQCLIPELKNAVTAQNVSSNKKLALFSAAKETKRTLEHEEQHAIQDLFWEKSPKITEDTIKFVLEQSPKYLGRYLRRYRRMYEERAKNEILAFYKEGDFSLVEITARLTLSDAKGSYYDFNKHNEQLIKESLKDWLTPEVLEKNKEEIEKIFKQVFIDEYKDSILHATVAIEALEDLGKSKKEIISLLITEPLSSWWKLAKRIYKQKHENKNR